jgi:beta-N-acetylhexosaminidase
MVPVPPATVVRRRRAAVAAAAAAAFVLGASFGANGEETDRPPAERRAPAVAAAPTASPAPEKVRALPLSEQVGKLVVLRFDGTEAPAYVRRALRRGWAAGAILFRDNIVSPQQLRSLTRQLRRGTRTTPIVSTDQEGGAVRNLRWAPPHTGQRGQIPRRDARAAARALRQAGINVTLAPVADVPSVAGAAMESRAFSRDAEQAAAAVRAAVDGWRDGGVAATAKHFPGLGGATQNTDHGSAMIDAAPTGRDLLPFRAAIQARVPLIMSSHARYPRLDGERIASQSPRILRTLLREELAYAGVVMTDSIEAAAARATGSTEQIAIRSIRAGNDIVLTTGKGSWLRVYRALLREARRSRAFRALVEASAARVTALQNTLT